VIVEREMPPSPLEARAAVAAARITDGIRISASSTQPALRGHTRSVIVTATIEGSSSDPEMRALCDLVAEWLRRDVVLWDSYRGLKTINVTAAWTDKPQPGTVTLHDNSTVVWGAQCPQ
jgi:hypothetical protein